MSWVVSSREVDYGGCNCSCFEADEVFGPFASEKEAAAYGKKNHRNGYRVQELKLVPLYGSLDDRILGKQQREMTEEEKKDSQHYFEYLAGIGKKKPA